MNCPSFEDLIAASMEPERHDAVRDHLATGCGICTRRLRLLDAVASTLGAGPLPSVPGEWLDRAIRIGDEDREVAVQEYTAALVFDSLEAGTVAGLRGDAPTQRHLLFRAGPYELDLVTLEGGAVAGQVIASEQEIQALRPASCLLTHGQETRQAPLDVNGDFHFAAVRPADYTLAIVSDRVLLVANEVRLVDDRAGA